MTSRKEITARVYQEIEAHCVKRGGILGPNVNRFVPHDLVTSFAVARRLSTRYQGFVAVAPEGHMYSWFLETLTRTVHSVWVNDPPATRCVSEGNLPDFAGKDILIVEDDLVSGASMRLVIAHLAQCRPAAIDLWLGHGMGFQHLENVPPEIRKVHLAEVMLAGTDYADLESDFFTFFEGYLRHS